MRSEHVVKGYSMYPLLRPGHRVVLDIHMTHISKGDIVAFFVSPKLVVLHRVVSADGDTIICKGDSNSFTDAPVAKETVYGVLNMVRVSTEKWRPAAAFQKRIYLSNYYGTYARLRKKLLFISYHVKRLLTF